MNICIGGCWHGSKLLKDQKSDRFSAKDNNTGRFITYKRFRVDFRGETYVFWVENTLSHLEANEKIKFYFERLELELPIMETYSI